MRCPVSNSDKRVVSRAANRKLALVTVVALLGWFICLDSSAVVQTGTGVRVSQPPKSGVVEEGPPGVNGQLIAAPLDEALAPYGTEVLVNQDPAGRPHDETSITANFTNPNNLVGAANDYRGADAGCGFYSSIDGGLTWQADGTLPLGGFAAAGDPSVAGDGLGNIYYSCLRFNRVGSANDIAVASSADGGLTWSVPVPVVTGTGSDDFNDKPYIAVDTTNGPFNGQIYVTWTNFGIGASIRRSFSVDGGATWAAPLTISDTQSNQGSVPAVGPNGEVYVVWEDFIIPRMLITKSTDGGVSFQTNIPVSDIVPIRSPLPGFAFRTNSFPTLAVDTTNGPCQGSVYVAWADFRNGDADIFFSASSDGGTTWSPATRIDDAPTGIHSFFPWMAVDPQGIIHVVFYDNRLSANLLDVFATQSSDCGQSFGSNDRVTNTSFNPALDGFGGAFIGDYIGVTATSQFVHPLYMSTGLRGSADIVTNRATASQAAAPSTRMPTPSMRQ